MCESFSNIIVERFKKKLCNKASLLSLQVVLSIPFEDHEGMEKIQFLVSFLNIKFPIP